MNRWYVSLTFDNTGNCEYSELFSHPHQPSPDAIERMKDSYSIVVICEYENNPVSIHLFLKYKNSDLYTIAAINLIVDKIKESIAFIEHEHQLKEQDDEYIDYEVDYIAQAGLIMKYVVVSDMHGNIKALQVAELLAEINSKDADVKLIINGDIYISDNYIYLLNALTLSLPTNPLNRNAIDNEINNLRYEKENNIITQQRTRMLNRIEQRFKDARFANEAIERYIMNLNRNPKVELIYGNHDYNYPNNQDQNLYIAIQRPYYNLFISHAYMNENFYVGLPHCNPMEEINRYSANNLIQTMNILNRINGYHDVVKYIFVTLLFAYVYNNNNPFNELEPFLLHLMQTFYGLPLGTPASNCIFWIWTHNDTRLDNYFQLPNGAKCLYTMFNKRYNALVNSHNNPNICTELTNALIPSRYLISLIDYQFHHRKDITNDISMVDDAIKAIHNNGGNVLYIYQHIGNQLLFNQGVPNIKYCFTEADVNDGIRNVNMRIAKTNIEALFNNQNPLYLIFGHDFSYLFADIMNDDTTINNGYTDKNNFQQNFIAESTTPITKNIIATDAPGSNRYSITGGATGLKILSATILLILVVIVIVIYCMRLSSTQYQQKAFHYKDT